MANLGQFVKMIDVPENKALVMYRSWLIQYGGRKLIPLFQTSRSTWFRAMANAHLPPVEDNWTGIFAFKKKSSAQRYASEHFPFSDKVVGCVRVWGRIAMHARGCRAQYARIETIDGLKFQERLSANKNYAHIKFLPIKRKSPKKKRQAR